MKYLNCFFYLLAVVATLVLIKFFVDIAGLTGIAVLWICGVAFFLCKLEQMSIEERARK